jgi:adenylate/nucleoside-diphosphate kinase
LKAVREFFHADENFTAALGDDTTKEINATGSADEVLARIRIELDPFFLRVDNPENVRTTAEIDEEEREAGNGLPKGDFGDYCPVTFVNDKWLAKGNFEMEATVYGKTYWMAGEKELEEFKADP